MKSTGLLACVTLMFAFGMPTQAVAQEPPPDQQLVATGAQVWAQNCTRCHQPRNPSERTDRDWSTIIQHMRVRANLTKAEAAAVAAYFRAVNPAETVVLPRTTLMPRKGAVRPTVPN